jgi:hypothetical protein
MLACNAGHFNKTGIIVLAVLSVAIDIDHLWAYLRYHNRLSLKGAWNTAVTEHEHERTIIHKPIGILIILLALSILLIYNHPITRIIFLAYVCHVFLDYIHLTKEGIREHRFITVLNFLFPVSASEIILDVLSIMSNIIIFYFVF